MSRKLYDDALLEKIQAWTRDTSLHLYGPNETRRLFEVIANDNNDNPIELPLISIRRNGGYNITNTNKKPMTYTSMRLAATQEKGLLLDAIPIQLEYQLDIYTRYFEEADAIARNFIFNIINFPKITVTIPYRNCNVEHNSTIRILPEIQDNSDIPERLISGEFTRISIGITIDDAYIWDIKNPDTLSIDCDVVEK